MTTWNCCSGAKVGVQRGKTRFGAALENSLSWVRQSKLIVDLETGVYLRANEMEAFILLD